MNREPAARILTAWNDLETHLRSALPVCAVAPPTQPAELLSALRINHSIGHDEEGRIRALREIRTRAAHGVLNPTEGDAAAFEAEVAALRHSLPSPDSESC